MNTTWVRWAGCLLVGFYFPTVCECLKHIPICFRGLRGCCCEAPEISEDYKSSPCSPSTCWWEDNSRIFNLVTLEFDDTNAKASLCRAEWSKLGSPVRSRRGEKRTEGSCDDLKGERGKNIQTTLKNVILKSYLFDFFSNVCMFVPYSGHFEYFLQLLNYLRRIISPWTNSWGRSWVTRSHRFISRQTGLELLTEINLPVFSPTCPEHKRGDNFLHKYYFYSESSLCFSPICWCTQYPLQIFSKYYLSLLELNCIKAEQSVQYSPLDGRHHI